MRRPRPLAAAALLLGLVLPLGRAANAGARLPLSDAPSVSLLFFGDGGGGNELQLRLAAVMLRTCQRVGCDLALVLGDNVYADGPHGPEDPIFEERMGRPYAGFQALPGFAFWAVVGNHDEGVGLDSELAWAARSALWRMPGLVFEVPGLPDWLRIQGIHTTPLYKRDEPAPTGDPAVDWQAQLARIEDYFCGDSAPGWKVLFGHHPIHSSSYGVSRRMAERVLPLIERCGIDFYLSGHVHHQEHVSSPAFEQLIQGAASLPRRSWSWGWFRSTPHARFVSYEPGFGVLHLSPAEARVEFFDADGTLIHSWSRPRTR